MPRGDIRVIGLLQVSFTLLISDHKARVQIEVLMPQVKCFEIMNQAITILNVFYSLALINTSSSRNSSVLLATENQQRL